MTHVQWLSELDMSNVAQVGGKNASLGEMLQRLREAHVRVPDGFATTVAAYWAFIDHNDLRARIGAQLARLRRDEAPLHEVGEAIRGLFGDAQFPDAVSAAIVEAYAELGRRLEREAPEVAVRSSATAEDLPEASFAGQQETFLNIRGDEALIAACRRCYASLFTDRAIAYRENHGIDHLAVGLSVGVQRMVRADAGGAGVMFSIDTETGFPATVLVNANWGLGETVVQGSVDPDEYTVFKPLLDDPERVPILDRKLGAKARKMVYAQGDEPTRLVDTPEAERRAFVLEEAEILELARWAVAIERHYDKPMDMEWAKDGTTGELFIVQARPENEYAKLIGGQAFEPEEANPMLGWRGASRYYSEGYRDGFALECRALEQARHRIGLGNIVIMVPFCRTPAEADEVLAAMAAHGLVRGRDGLEVYVMCEIPANVVLAQRFAERFDGFSIGSNDLTQLTLGVDRDSDRLAHLFNEDDEAVRTLIAQVIERAHGAGRKIGLCGQAPSDHPEFAEFLVASGIDSISVDPSSFIAVKRQVAQVEARRGTDRPQGRARPSPRSISHG